MDHLTNVTGPDEFPATKWELELAEKVIEALRKIMEHGCKHTCTKVSYDKPHARPILPESL